VTITNVENIIGNPLSILQILEESYSYSDTGSIFSVDSNNYEPREIKNGEGKSGFIGEQLLCDVYTDANPFY
jgi:hypothetical protein